MINNPTKVKDLIKNISKGKCCNCNVILLQLQHENTQCAEHTQ
jgi:hypothetical protein